MAGSSISSSDWGQLRGQVSHYNTNKGVLYRKGVSGSGR